MRFFEGRYRILGPMARMIKLIWTRRTASFPSIRTSCLPLMSYRFMSARQRYYKITNCTSSRYIQIQNGHNFLSNNNNQSVKYCQHRSTSTWHTFERVELRKTCSALDIEDYSVSFKASSSRPITSSLAFSARNSQYLVKLSVLEFTKMTMTTFITGDYELMNQYSNYRIKK